MAGVVFGIVVLVLQIYPTMTHAYEIRMKQVAEDQWRGTRRSREAATAVNERIGAQDRLLVTSFHYWKGLSSGAPCAVFTYYLRPSIPVLLRPSDAGFASLMRDVRNYDIDWALLSPTPGTQAQEVIGGFVKEMGITPVRLEGVFLFEIPDLVSPLMKRSLSCNLLHRLVTIKLFAEMPLSRGQALTLTLPALRSNVKINLNLQGIRDRR